MSTRKDRADIIYYEKHLQFKVFSRRLMGVPSQYKHDKIYKVTVKDRHAVSGSCPDYKYRHPKGGCKHMIAADKYIKLKL